MYHQAACNIALAKQNNVLKIVEKDLVEVAGFFAFFCFFVEP